MTQDSNLIGPVPPGEEELSTWSCARIQTGNRPHRTGPQPSDGDPGGEPAPGGRMTRHLKNSPAGVEPASTARRGPLPVPLAPASQLLSAFSLSSPGIEPGLRPSQGRVRSGTLQGHHLQPPGEESNLSLRFRKPSCLPHTRRVHHALPPGDLRRRTTVQQQLQVPGSNRANQPYESRLGTDPPAVTRGRFELPVP